MIMMWREVCIVCLGLWVNLNCFLVEFKSCFKICVMVVWMFVLFGVVNVVVVVVLWVYGGGLYDDFLMSVGCLTGLLGVYFVFVELFVFV